MCTRRVVTDSKGIPAIAFLLLLPKDVRADAVEDASGVVRVSTQLLSAAANLTTDAAVVVVVVAAADVAVAVLAAAAAAADAAAAAAAAAAAVGAGAFAGAVADCCRCRCWWC